MAYFDYLIKPINFGDMSPDPDIPDRGNSNTGNGMISNSGPIRVKIEPVTFDRDSLVRVEI